MGLLFSASDPKTMWQYFLKRTKTYRHERRRHLLIDGLLLGCILTLGVFILWEKISLPESVSPPGGGTVPPPLGLGLVAEARYFTSTGEQIGTGPYPPVLGERMTFWIFFTAIVKNATSHDTTLVVKLGENAEWTGQGSVPGAGWIAAPTDQAVVADLGNLDAGATIQGTLEIAITPHNVEAPLIKEAKLTGVDDGGQRVVYVHGEIR